jgi:hypothetical protein
LASSIFFDDVSFDGGINGQLGIDLAGMQEIRQLLVADVPEAEALAGHGFGFGIAVTACPQQVFQSDGKFPAVLNIEKRQSLSLLDILARVIDVELEDASFLGGRDLALVFFISSRASRSRTRDKTA